MRLKALFTFMAEDAWAMFICVQMCFCGRFLGWLADGEKKDKRAKFFLIKGNPDERSTKLN